MSLVDQQWCPTSLQVTVVQARGLRIKGKSGTNDAYALMQVGKEKYQTSVVEKSVAPVWKEEAAFDLPPLPQGGGGGGGRGGGTERSTLHVHVLHRALVGPDKLLGQAVINLLQLSEDKTRNKTEWFKLLDKTGKADKDRGEVLVDIQFMRNNMTASMFDLSAAGKSRSRLGKLKDKVRGKKKESDAASTVVPSFSQVLTDSEEEDGEVAAGKDEKKKKNKMKSLFSPKSNLQRNMSQSMSVLPAKNSSLSGSRSSGLNVDPSDGKKKFKFMIHKRSGSSDSKDSSSSHQKHGAAEQSNLCINGSHVYCEEPQARTSRIGSNFSLTSSGHGSMEDVPESAPPSVDSLRAVRQYSPWTEEEEEETAEVENIKEDVGELRREEEERIRMEEESRRQEEELERLAEEKMRREEEERRKEEEKVKREEAQRIRREEEERAQEARRREEERARREEEHERLAEEKRRLEEQERRRIEEEEKRQREEEERIRMEEEMAQEERRRQEERELEEVKRRLEEERRAEEEKVRKEEAERAQEERRREEEEMVRRQEKELDEKRRLEEQERRQREEEEMIKKEEERKQEEEEKAMKEKEEFERLVEEKRKLEEDERKRIEAEEKIKREEEERIRVEEERRAKEEERFRRQEEEREKLAEEKRILEEQERMIIEEKEKRQREEEERIRKEERRRKEEEEERVRRQEFERLAEEKRRQEEEERRRTEEEKVKREEEEKIRKDEEERAQEERRRQEEEERARKEKEEMERLAEEKRRLEEQEKRRIEEEERIRREEKAEKEKKEEQARKLEKEKLAGDAEEQKRRENKTSHKAVAVESPAEVPSTNPFDENFSNNPFEEVPDSDGSTVQQRCQSAASSVGSKTVSADEKDLIGSQREKRPAPQPPGRSQAERQSQREQDGSTPHPAQINKQSKDKDAKTVSVLPQRSVQMITPLSRSPMDPKNAQSLAQSSATKGTTNGAKHGKRPAPSRPRSVEEGPSSEPQTSSSSGGNISHECGSKAKQEPVVYGLNPFEDDEDENENELTAQDDTRTSGKPGSIQWPPAVSQAADKDAASQTKIRSSKVARAPPLPAKKAATPSTSINQNTEGGHVTDDPGVTVHKNSVTNACVPESEAVSRVHVQETPLQESQPVTVQSAGEEAGGKKEGPPTASRRLQPVKPLNPLEQQPVSVVQEEKYNKSTGILCEVQKKTKVNDSGLKGPYSQLTREELISLVLKQKNQLSERDKKISELEQYIDNLLVRVIEEQPSILMSMNSMKKPV